MTGTEVGFGCQQARRHAQPRGDFGRNMRPVTRAGRIFL
jgi:hypothetical protein